MTQRRGRCSSSATKNFTRCKSMLGTSTATRHCTWLCSNQAPEQTAPAWSHICGEEARSELDQYDGSNFSALCDYGTRQRLLLGGAVSRCRRRSRSDGAGRRSRRRWLDTSARGCVLGLEGRDRNTAAKRRRCKFARRERIDSFARYLRATARHRLGGVFFSRSMTIFGRKCTSMLETKRAAHLCTWPLKERQKKMAELLLRRSADPNITNAEGSTALHVLCKCDYNFFDLMVSFI
ncbi:unnamed protein product [Trichogramma brassicae]|uniref:Uncharacterized protein n=1 Tax=Trichogramma brassicae TaxID=86971 RepID=A0A6H5IY70_9HYME|nr:unnamed protein product [Trichogramma brassicae]